MIPRLFALLLLTLPNLAQARCVTADDLATGIAFKRQDGRSGLALAKGKTVDINYNANPTTAWRDKRVTDRGIYELTRGSYPSDEEIVGAGPGGYFEYRLSGKPPVPKAGSSWKTTVTTKTTSDAGTEAGPQVQRGKMTATYSFQAVTEATLSGCTYRIQPVEATFLAENTHTTKRWIYFPDLGFGLETRVTVHNTGEDRKLGLTSFRPKDK